MKNKIVNNKIETVATLEYWVENYPNKFKGKKESKNLFSQKLLGLLLVVISCYCIFSLTGTFSETVMSCFLLMSGIFLILSNKDFLKV